MKKGLWPVVSLVTLLMLAACGGGGGGGGGAATPKSGSGALSNPFIIDVGTTYAGTAPFVGGSPFGTNPSGIFYRFVTQVSGFYKGSVTGTNGTSDLAFYLFFNDGTFISECDETFTGNEICSSRDDNFGLNAGFAFLIEVFNWGNTSSDFNLLVAVD